MPQRETRVRSLVPIAAGGIALFAYVRTMLPGIAYGDWGEMQTIPHVFGVAHPTGYPTFVLLAWVTQLIPIGSVAARGNFLSVVLVAGAVAVASLILLRLGVRPVLAVLGSVAFGAAGTVWAAATVAEVNPLHLLLVALLVHRALIWEARRRRIDLVIGGLLLGSAVGNHLLILFVAPFIVGFVIWVGRGTIAFRPRDALAGAGAAALGLGVYLTIPVAAALGPPLAYNHPITLEAFWDLVSGAQFRSQFDFLTPAGPADLLIALPGLWGTLVARGSVALPVLGVLGLGLLVWRRPLFGLMAVGIVITNAYLWANYLRLEHYLLVPFLMLGIGATYAVELIARLVGRIPGRRWSRVAVIGLTVVSAIGVLALGSDNWTAADRSREVGGDEFVQTVFSELPPNAAILTPWDDSTPLWHGRYVLGERPDVLVIDDSNIVYDGWGTRERRIAALIDQRPVFILRLHDPELDPTRAMYRLEPAFVVRVGVGGPTAAVIRTVMRVLPRDASGIVAVKVGSVRSRTPGSGWPGPRPERERPRSAIARLDGWPVGRSPRLGGGPTSRSGGAPRHPSDESRRRQRSLPGSRQAGPGQDRPRARIRSDQEGGTSDAIVCLLAGPSRRAGQRSSHGRSTPLSNCQTRTRLRILPCSRPMISADESSRSTFNKHSSPSRLQASWMD